MWVLDSPSLLSSSFLISVMYFQLLARSFVVLNDYAVTIHRLRNEVGRVEQPAEILRCRKER